MGRGRGGVGAVPETPRPVPVDNSEMDMCDTEEEIALKLADLELKSDENKRKMREAREKRQKKTTKKKEERAIVSERATHLSGVMSLEDMAAMVAEIESECADTSSFAVGDRTAREATGNVRPVVKAPVLATLNEDEELGMESELDSSEYSDDVDDSEHLVIESVTRVTPDSDSDRIWEAARSLSIQQAQENKQNLDVMDKSSKKIHKSLVTKLGAVQLGSFSHAVLKLKDGSEVRLDRPTILALLRHPTNPGPDRLVMFGAPSAAQVQDKDDVENVTKGSIDSYCDPLDSNQDTFSGSLLARAMATHVVDSSEEEWDEEEWDEEEWDEEDEGPPSLVVLEHNQVDDYDDEEDSSDDMPEPIVTVI